MDKMTIFFNKRTGGIKIIAPGIQTMNVFGEEKQDYELIYDFIELEFDRYVLENSGSFYIDESKELKLRNAYNLTKYL
jgi:hypothetical protein